MKYLVVKADGTTWAPLPDRERPGHWLEFDDLDAARTKARTEAERDGRPVIGFYVVSLHAEAHATSDGRRGGLSTMPGVFEQLLA